MDGPVLPGDVRILRRLITVRHKPASGWLLVGTVQCGSPDVVEWLADLKREGMRLPHELVAIRYNRVAILQLLLEGKNVGCCNCMLVAEQAAFHGHTDVLEALMNHEHPARGAWRLSHPRRRWMDFIKNLAESGRRDFVQRFGSRLVGEAGMLRVAVIAGDDELFGQYKLVLRLAHKPAIL